MPLGRGEVVHGRVGVELSNGRGKEECVCNYRNCCSTSSKEDSSNVTAPAVSPADSGKPEELLQLATQLVTGAVAQAQERVAGGKVSVRWWRKWQVVGRVAGGGGR